MRRSQALRVLRRFNAEGSGRAQVIFGYGRDWLKNRVAYLHPFAFLSGTFARCSIRREKKYRPGSLAGYQLPNTQSFLHKLARNGRSTSRAPVTVRPDGCPPPMMYATILRRFWGHSSEVGGGYSIRSEMVGIHFFNASRGVEQLIISKRT